MSAGRDFLLFIFFLIVLGIAWFLTGGPSRTISHSGWFLNGSGIAIPSVPVTIPDRAVYPDKQSNTEAATQNTPSAWDYFFNYKPGLGETPTPLLSPYASSVRLSRANAQASDPAQEYLVIDISRNIQSPITISGWSLVNPSGIKATIGNAAEIPFLGQVNAQTPITLAAGSTVSVTTGRSPNGTSFRVNECTGYFEQFQAFTPALSKECPSASDEILAHPETLGGNDQCREFMDRIPRCTILLDTRNMPANVGSTCQAFIFDKLSYAGCLNAHQRDPGFYKKEWRIFLNRDQEMWKNQHDVIRLLDENDKMIAQVSY